MTLEKLNALRARNGKTQLRSWKNGKAKLAEAIANEQPADRTDPSMPMGENGNELVDELPKQTAEPVSQEVQPSGPAVPEVGQSEDQVDQTDPTMPMGENGNSLVDPIEPEQKPEGEKIPRGAINAMCVELLQTDMPYEAIVEAIRAKYPAAKTTARSLASVAMDLRRDGVDVPSRRKPAKAKQAKTEGWGA